MPRPPRHRHNGFTLLELLFVAAIVALLATLALPALGDMAARARLRTEINALHHALHRARSESIKRNQYVALCPSADGSQCDYRVGWSAGWLLYVESSKATPPRRNPSERLLLTHRGRKSVQIIANRRYFVSRTRRFRATNGSFLACDTARRVAGRALIVSYTGRPRARPEADLGGRLVC